MLIRITKWLEKVPENEKFCKETADKINGDYPQTATIIEKGEWLAIFCKNSYLRQQYLKVTEIHFAKTKKRFKEE